MTEQATLWGDTVEVQEAGKVSSLSDRFIVPPFSVLDARQGYWQERKRAWLALGIKGELGRGETNCPGSPGDTRKDADKRSNVTGAPSKPAWATGTGTENMAPGTSIFDPVLCEITYSWFCPPSGCVLDPFAGGSVRGIIAHWLGYRYVGVDLSAQQLQANEEQADELLPDQEHPRWVLGDSRNLETLLDWQPFDFLFTCPPYYNLEVYGDDPRDLSTAATYAEFLVGYKEIIKASVGLLQSNRFACIIVGNVRADDGSYYDLVGDTVRIFGDAGAALYNEAVLVTSVGSLPIRVGKQFTAGRKLGKTHQNVLVFVKGDWREAVASLTT